MSGQHTALSGKTCLVTGATSGIGLVTAAALAQRGARVIGVSRSAQKCAETQARLRQETGNPAIEYLAADLSSLAEVRRAADAVTAHCHRLDVLVNNVGAFFMQRRLSADGFEMTWALNYLGVHLLTMRLLDTVRGAAPSRIVIVSSAMHKGARIDFDHLNGRRLYNGIRAYGQSKLALVMFTYDLARRLAGTGVTANALHPGFVASSIYDHVGIGGRLVPWVMQHVALTPEEGAETSIHLAAAPEVAEITGRYFVRKQPVPSSPASYDAAATARLMAVSAEMTGL